MEKQIESYWIKKYDSGIIQLCINTERRWVSYHRYNDDWYEVAGKEFRLEEALPKELNTSYLVTEMQEKDQISFYYIPFNLIK